MSGSDLADDLLHPVPAPSDVAAQSSAEDRLPWPGAALLILGLCAGLWLGIGMVLTHLLD